MKNEHIHGAIDALDGTVANEIIFRFIDVCMGMDPSLDNFYSILYRLEREFGFKIADSWERDITTL